MKGRIRVVDNPFDKHVEARLRAEQGSIAGRALFVFVVLAAFVVVLLKIVG